MPLPTNDIVRLAKDGFVDVIETAALDVDTVLADEKTSWMDQSVISIFTEGYARAPVASPFVQGELIVDSLGGRDWLLLFKIRLFLDLKADEEAAQFQADVLLPKIVRAIEQNPTLGTANNAGEPKIIQAAVPSGRLAKVESSNSSNMVELLMLEMDAQVHLSEPANIT